MPQETAITQEIKDKSLLYKISYHFPLSLHIIP
jgi:hypothetical protein